MEEQGGADKGWRENRGQNEVEKGISQNLAASPIANGADHIFLCALRNALFAQKKNDQG